MKKIKFLALTALFCAMGTNAFAQTPLADGYLRYETSGDNATITGFVATTKVAAVTIPATVTDPDPAKNGKKYNVTKIGANAFKGETIIESVSIADTNVGEIEAGAFENCTNLTTVTIGKKVATIAKAFNGCSKLATVNFNTPANGDNQTIAAGCFEGTAIVTLDLTASHVLVVNQLFEALNNTVTTIKLPATLTTIGTDAFKQLATLSTIDWSSVKLTNEVTICATAFDGAPLITSLVLPGTKKMTLADNSLKGSNIAELTITSPAAATGAGFTVNATGAGAKLTTLTLAPNAAGKILGAINNGAFTGATKLATININGDMESEDQIASGSFVGAGSATTDDPTDFNLTVNYTPTGNTAKAKASINEAAFAASAVTADVKLVTSTVYGKWINDNYTNGIYRVELSFSAATEALAVAKGGSSKYYYAKLYIDATATPKGYKIAKKQGDATVIVYQGYTDDSDASIYMENLRIFDGYYWVPAGAPVIVKSTAADDVVLTESDGTKTSTLQTVTTGVGNQITVKDAGATGLAVNDATTAGKTTYALAPIADYGYLWSKISDSRVIVGKDNGAYNPKTKTTTADFLIECKNVAAARLNVIWLDGTEDNTTAIQTVKQNVEDGVIYNLAGQKVDANFKGVVIKNGKKMIQK